jgi:hypothetical protein
MIFFNIKQEDDNTVSSPNFCLKEKNHKKSGGKKQKKKKKEKKDVGWTGQIRGPGLFMSKPIFQ